MTSDSPLIEALQAVNAASAFNASAGFDIVRVEPGQVILSNGGRAAMVEPCRRASCRDAERADRYGVRFRGGNGGG